MSNEEPPTDFYSGPAYALVIGISEYQYGGKTGLPLEDHQFPNLKLADKDAQDFANFLKDKAFPKFNEVRVLINEQAKLSKIKDEFDILRKNCKPIKKDDPPKNPLVVVYFSGHGLSDPDDRNYLIPHDAQRNRLYSTALLNREFSFCLNDIGTNRLVVFIDACHAGATVGVEGMKGLYEYHKDLAPDPGRYVIASCGPKQNSYEWKEKKNSIFTGRLLQLLNFETDDFDDLEHPEVDLADLYPKLRDRVVATAHNEYSAEQKPDSDINERTGIVLAVNPKVRDRKLKESDQIDIRRFLDLVCNAISRTTKSIPKEKLTTRLMSYVIEQDNTTAFQGLYSLFDELLKDWKAAEEAGRAFNFEDASNLLILRHKVASESATSRDTENQQSATPHDNLVAAQKLSHGFHDRPILGRDYAQTIASSTLGQEPPPVQMNSGVRQRSTNPFALRIQAGSEEPIARPPAKVFVSYSHKDRVWLELFVKMVAPLVRDKTIDLWYDETMETGVEWREEIEKALDSATIAVLLVSADFLNSDFIANHELPKLLDRADENGVRIYRIKVSACLDNITPIGKYQAAHDPNTPLDSLSEAECKNVLSKIAEKIRLFVTKTG